jgi:hypothetical protein
MRGLQIWRLVMAPSRQIKSCSDTSGLNGHCADRECAVCNLVALHLSAAIGEQLRQLGDVDGDAPGLVRVNKRGR